VGVAGRGNCDLAKLIVDSCFLTMYRVVLKRELRQLIPIAREADEQFYTQSLFAPSSQDARARTPLSLELFGYCSEDR